MTFSGDIKAFKNVTNNALTSVFQGVALKLTARVILRTPVDTGRLRGNWQVGLNVRPTDTVVTKDKGGGSTVGKARSKIKDARKGDTIAIINNLPYAIPIENGSSKQAPQGMVRVVVREFSGIVSRTVRGI